MWLATTIGFFSVIEKDGQICVRARSHKDIKAFKSLIPGCGKIIRTNLADYRFRVFIPKDKFEHEFYRLAKLINYNNFKNEVKKTNKAREILYHSVWVTLLGIEKENSRILEENEYDVEIEKAFQPLA